MQASTSKLSKTHLKPLYPDDLIAALTSHFHSKLSAVEMDELILDGAYAANA